MFKTIITFLFCQFTGKKPVLYLLLLSLLASYGQAKIISLDSDENFMAVTAEMEYFLETDTTLEIDQIKDQYADRFTSVQRDMLIENLAGKNLWLRLIVENPTQQTKQRTLTIRSYAAEYIELYNSPDNSVLTTGHGIRFSERPLSSSTMALPIQFEPGLSTQYIRVLSNEITHLEFDLFTFRAFYQHEFRKDLLTGAVLSLFLIVTVLAFFQTLRHRDLIYLIITGYAGFLMVTQLAVSGYFSPWLDIEFTDLAIRNSSTLISSILLLILVSKINQDLPALVMKLVYFFSSVLVFAGIYALSVNTIQFAQIFLTLAATLNLIAAIEIIFYKSHFKVYAKIAAAILIIHVLLIIGFMNGFFDSHIAINVFGKLFSLLSASLLLLDYYSPSSRPVSLEPSENDQLQFPLLFGKINDDIRIPAGGVVEMADLMGETNLSVKQRELLDTMSASGVELLQKTEEITTLLRIFSGKPLPESTDLNLRELLHKLTVNIANEATTKGLELINNTSSLVPQTVTAHGESLTFVLSSLLWNAIRFTQTGEVVLHVTFSEDRNIRFRITDTGQGIATEQLLNLFQFTQSDISPVSTTMPICSMLVKQLGGQLSVSSEIGRGTTFWFSLPLPSAKVQTKSRHDVKKMLRTVKMLLVDDNNSSRKTLEQLAINLGIRVDSCSSAIEALAMLQTKNQLDQAYDFLLVDHHMPQITGIQMAAKLKGDKKLRQYLKIILMTGLDLKENDPILRNNGIDHLLQKPVSSDELYKLLLSILPQFRADKL